MASTSFYYMFPISLSLCEFRIFSITPVSWHFMTYGLMSFSFTVLSTWLAIPTWKKHLFSSETSGGNVVGVGEKGSSNYFLPNCILSPLHFLFLKLSGQILGPKLTLKSIFSFSLCFMLFSRRFPWLFLSILPWIFPQVSPIYFPRALSLTLSVQKIFVVFCFSLVSAIFSSLSENIKYRFFVLK